MLSTNSVRLYYRRPDGAHDARLEPALFTNTHTITILFILCACFPSWCPTYSLMFASRIRWCWIYTLSSLSCWSKKTRLMPSKSDIVANKVPLWSVYRAPSYDPYFTPWARLGSELAYLAMLCQYALPGTDLHTGQASSEINDMLKWANFVENGASTMRSSSYDGAWYAEHNFITRGQYHRCCWNDASFLSFAITFDKF